MIEKSADPELSTYLAQAKEESNTIKRSDNWLEFIEKHPDLRSVAIDEFEQKCYRSEDKVRFCFRIYYA